MIRKILLAAVAVVAAAVLFGAGYQAFMDWYVPRTYPLRGRLVDVGGHSLRIDCIGSGGPTVVIDGGIGTATMGWTLVQNEVAKSTRVCTYDRAGYFASDPISKDSMRTSDVLAKELHTLLANAGERGPFVLVGHSFGGFTARVYHQLYPSDVAGVVMVDGSQEDAQATLESLLPASRVKTLLLEEKILFVTEPVLARLGVLRLFARPEGTPSDWKFFPVGTQAVAAKYMALTKFDDVEIAEFRHMDESGEQARRSGTLGDLPLAVVTAKLPWLGPPVTKEDVTATIEFQRRWVSDLQMRLVRLSTRGRQVIAEKSNHGVEFLEPEVVVGAVLDVVKDSSLRSRTADSSAALRNDKQKN